MNLHNQDFFNRIGAENVQSYASVSCESRGSFLALNGLNLLRLHIYGDLVLGKFQNRYPDQIGKESVA